jgi:hypothetical protein
MHPASQAPQWAIAGVGTLRPCFDRVVIVSSTPVGALKARLPITALQLVSHAFNVLTYDGPDRRLRSRIVTVGTQTVSPWAILATHEATLGRYRVTQAEIAFDMDVATGNGARGTLFALVGQLAKPRHQRRQIWSVHKPDQTPPLGRVSEPTFYLEDRGSSVKLKCYARHEKLAGGGFGSPVVRLEWTLTGKPALERHLGGNQIKNLQTADLNAFLKRNLRLEQVDHVALGNLFRGIKIKPQNDRRKPETPDQLWQDPNYWAERGAFLVLRVLAYREQEKFGDWHHALEICQKSPAQIRGYCRELRDKEHPLGRGRPKHDPQTRRSITDHRINACFHKIQLSPVTPTE